MPDSAAVLMIEVINNIDALYDRAWNHLMVFVVALTGIVGILMPILSQWYQRRTFRIEEKQIRSDLTAYIDQVLEGEVIDKRLNIIKSEITSELKTLRNEYKRAVYSLEGKAYYLQGATRSNMNEFRMALRSFIIAASNFIKGGDEPGYQITPDAIKNSLASLSRGGIDEEIEELFNDLLKLMKEKNESGRYTRDLTLLKRAMKESLSRGTDEVVLE